MVKCRITPQITGLGRQTMTDQNYKLVPLEPTEEMLYEARTAYYLPATVSMEAAIRAAIASAPEPVCKEPPVAWWNGMPASPLEGTPPSIRWGADAEDTHHDIPLYAGFNPVHTSPSAPEPVCRWRNPQSRENGYSWVAGCGLEWDFGDWNANPGNSDITFCPHCGKKVEVVGDE